MTSTQQREIAKLKADYLAAPHFADTFYANKMAEGFPAAAIKEAMKQAQEELRKEQVKG